MTARRPSGPGRAARRPDAGRSRTATGRTPAVGRAVPRSSHQQPPPEPGPLAQVLGGVGRRRLPVLRPITWVSVTFVALAILLAPAARTYLVQRSQIDAAQAQNAQLRAQVSTMSQQQQRWRDPTYVAAQARSRLNFVFPGETALTVKGPLTGTADPDPRDLAASASAAAATSSPGQAWFGKLWTSVQLAGSDGTGPGTSR